MLIITICFSELLSITSSIDCPVSFWHVRLLPTDQQQVQSRVGAGGAPVDRGRARKAPRTGTQTPRVCLCVKQEFYRHTQCHTI